MRARCQDQVLFICHADVPEHRKGGSVVRNSYFWALRSISGRANRYQDWEYEIDIWPALQRMLLSFSASGYLGLRETVLEFPPGEKIPAILQPVSTWQEAVEKLG